MVLLPWHKAVWKGLMSEIDKGRMPHALLLSGSEGSGKSQLVELLAKRMLCQLPTKDGLPCNTCYSCLLKKTNAHPDFREVNRPEGKNQISVDSIRELTAFLSLTESLGGHRVVIINPTEAMTINASNSLLKTLEEPSSNVLLILVASTPSRLLATIRSRCRHIRLPSPKLSDTVYWLQNQSLNHSVDQLISVVGNCPFKAQHLDANKDLIVLYQTFLDDLIQVMNETLSIVTLIDKYKSLDINMLLTWQLSWIMALIKYHSLGEPLLEDQSLGVVDCVSDRLAPLLPSFSQQWLLYDNLLQSVKLLHLPLNQVTFLEQLVIYWLEARNQK